MENLNLFYQDVGPSSSAGRHLTQEEVAKEELAIRISQRYALLEEERHTVKENKEAVKRIKGEALKEKDDPGAFIFPIRLEGKVNENALADTRSNINIMPYRIFETLGREDMKEIDRGITMIDHTQAEPMGKLSNVLCQVETMGTNDDEAGASRSKRSRLKTVEEVLLPQVHHEFLLWEGCTRDAKSRYNTRLAQLLPRHIYSPCIVNCDVLNRMDCDGEIDEMLRIRVREAESEEEIFTSVAWIRAFNINELIYVELCHEFYSTYEFDEVCADDEFQTKKIIKFRLGGRAHSLTLLEFARRLGLYQAVEIEKDGFNVYFEGGLRNDENFNAQDYWLSISREDNLSFSRNHTSTIRNPILRVIHKMITYGLCQRTTGLDDCKMDEEERSWDSKRESNFPWDLDTTTLRDLIDSDGKLIPEDPQPGDAIERMEYRQSYHWDKYHGVFEHMTGVYSVPLQGAYNPPGYAQPQYDQYYQQYPPPPPQQQQDDDE
ncbi:hypothetical protein Tco_1068954 [Tanacetum coccineum]|uniref:Uncharacterized protein n=1 Tax=Tanacetum coccineum TaxID=301880 RepID=A0ABQ5HJ06_9ASTR